MTVMGIGSEPLVDDGALFVLLREVVAVEARVARLAGVRAEGAGVGGIHGDRAVYHHG